MSWFVDFIQLLYPLSCGACGSPLEKNEKTICTACLSFLPVTNFHLYEDNPVAQIFWGRIHLEAATALLYFHKKGRTQYLLHNLKYNNRQDIGIMLGQILGNKIKDIKPYNSIDYIVPVPLHPKKIKQRGYNQSECFAIGLSSVLEKPVNLDVLVRSTETQTQTNKSRNERWQNVSEAFSLQYKNYYDGKHFLIVDDVITTGSTIEACANVLLKIPEIKISVAAIAKA
jgi:ComF family protein